MKKIIGLLMVCALFGMILMGCQNAAKGSDTTKFEGRWKYPSSESEMYITFKGNSFVYIMKDTDGWTGFKGTFTFTDTEMTNTQTHESSSASSTEAEAIAAMTAVSSQEPMKTGYTLTTNTLKIDIMSDVPFVKQ